MKHFVPALLISLALSSFNPGVAVAAAPAGTPAGSDAQTHPLVMQQVANVVATAPTGALQPFRAAPRAAAVGGSGGPQREVFGFALTSSLSDPTIGYPSWNFSLLSTVAVFGLHVNDNGHFAADSGWNVWYSSQMADFVKRAHQYGTKVVLTIILQDFSAGTPHMCAGLASRGTTVTDTVAEVGLKGVDGVNLDYEGLQVSCANGVNPRAAMVDLATQLKAKLVAPGSYLSVDTYASSAADPAGFFDVPGLNASVDSFFVMAYDSDRSNYGSPPLSCQTNPPTSPPTYKYCLNPVSPLTGYLYNDTRASSEYRSAVGASKVILGLPYYSRADCVSQWAENQYPEFPGDSRYNFNLPYTQAVTMATDPTNSSYALHRDSHDQAGLSPWSTWTSSSNPACQMEMYWDDVTSLGQKYDLVNRDGLRGVGLWNLNFGGGAPELWGTLSTYFSCPVTVNGPASPTSTEFNVGIDPGGCAVSSFEVQQYDSTLNQGWYGLPQLGGGARTLVAEGYPGYTYQFRVRAHATSGVVGAWATASVTVATTATSPHPFKGLYTLDAYGGMHSADSPPLSDSAYWAGWNIAKTAKALPTGPQSGFVLDGYGGLHTYGAPGLSETAGSPASHRWGWDIARDFAFLPDGTGGLVLDGYGGIHPFRVNGSAAPLQVQGAVYWGWDIGRKIVVFADGSGGYVLDGWGGLHPFGINGPPPVTAASLTGGGYWPGWDIARDVVLVPGNGNHSGYTLDGLGGIHPFHPTSDTSTMPASIIAPRWGWDIARTLWLLPGSAGAGYVMDGWGGVHPLGGAPAVANFSYWPGWDIAKVIWGG